MKKKNKNKKSLRKKILYSLLGLFVVIFGVAGYYVYSLYSFANHIQTSPEDSIFNKLNPQSVTKTSAELTPPKWEGKERVNILLLGGDSRGLSQNEVPRSDSVMIASLDPVTKKSYLFSILRDTYVDIPGEGQDRINTALSRGGPELAMKTVSNLMGIPVQYYVYTDFKGFIALVDAIGGIELDVEKDMKYSDSADGHLYDINLKKGYQHLDGTTALQYVRFRHDATSDFTRTERQRKFLKALAEKLQSSVTLLKLPNILQSVDPYIETNLNVNQMIKLASLGFEVKTDGMVSQQIPPTELLEEKRVGGAEVLGVDPAKLKIFIKQLFGEVPVNASTKAPAGGQLSQGANDSAVAGSPKATVKPTTGVKPTVKPSSAATPKATVKPTSSAKPATGAKETANPAGGKASPAASAAPKPAGSVPLSQGMEQPDAEQLLEDVGSIDLNGGDAKPAGSGGKGANQGANQTDEANAPQVTNPPAAAGKNP